jgi:hypothetical protein
MRLLPGNMTLDIDYAGIWRRAQRKDLLGQTMLTLAPEDDLLILAIHGGHDLWRKVHWACDVAAFIRQHQNLDWDLILSRARAQGSLHMVLLSIAMARKYCHAILPVAVMAAVRRDRTIVPMLHRIMADWLALTKLGQPSGKALLTRRARLHDGFVRRGRFMAQAMLLPNGSDVASLSLPRGLGIAYFPIKLADRLITWPLRRIYRRLRGLTPLRQDTRIKLLLICGPWGSGTTAVAGMAQRLGARGFGPYFRTSDERTPVTYELIPFRVTVQRYASEDTVALRPGRAEAALDGLHDLRQGIERQEFGHYDPGASAPIFFQYPLSALLLPQICTVFDTRLVYVMRSLEDIERTRIRRKWRASEGRQGAKIIYQVMDEFERLQSHPILTVNYADLLAAPAEHARELARFAGLEPDPASLREAIAFVRPKDSLNPPQLP